MDDRNELKGASLNDGAAGQDWHRKMAMQLAVQLPADKEDRKLVLRLTKMLSDQFLDGVPRIFGASCSPSAAHDENVIALSSGPVSKVRNG